MSTELATQPEVKDGQVAVWEDVPEELLNADGFENGGIDDVVVPRLLLAQALSPAVKKSSDVYIEGLNQGEFFNNVTRKVYGPGVRVIPVLFTKNRILFNQKEIDCRSENGINGGIHSPSCATCEYAQWGSGKDGKGTACTEFRNFLCYVPEDREFAILSFKKSTAQAGKMLYTTAIAQKRQVLVTQPDNKPKLQKTIQLPIYGCEYMLNAVEKSNDDGSFYTIGFKIVQDVTDRELLKNLKMAHERFKKVNVIATEEE